MGAKHTQSKFALIFVHMTRWDFPAVWPEAF